MIIKKSHILIAALSMSFIGMNGTLANAYYGSAKPTAYKQDKDGNKERKQKTAEALSTETQRVITKVVEVYDLKDYQGALAMLLDLKKKHDRDKLKGIDSATMWQFLGTVYYDLEQPEKSVAAFEEFLKYKENVNEGTYFQIFYNVIQLKFAPASEMDEGPARTKAINEVKALIKRLEAESPRPLSITQDFFISQVYLISEDYKTTLKYIDKVLAQAAATFVEPKENWYQTQLQAHFSMENYSGAVDTLLTLINNWPKPNYWRQLAAAYSQNQQDKNFYAVSEINYEAGFFERSNDYTNMAQIFMLNEVPIKAAWTLESGLKDKIVNEDEKTYSLLSQAYLRANEYGKALDPASKAAKLKSDWKLWMQIGQIEQSRANYDKAQKAYTEALDLVPNSNTTSRFTLLTLQGNALTELKKFKPAKEAFDSANKIASNSQQRTQMTNWYKYLKNEENRYNMLQ